MISRKTLYCSSGYVLTLPGVSQIGDWFRHNNWSVDALAGTLYTHFEEDIVQYTLHNVPITDDTRSGVKCTFQLPTSSRINVGIVSDELALASEFAITVSTHNGRKDETGGFVERPAGLDEVRA